MVPNNCNNEVMSTMSCELIKRLQININSYWILISWGPLNTILENFKTLSYYTLIVRKRFIVQKY